MTQNAIEIINIAALALNGVALGAVARFFHHLGKMEQLVESISKRLDSLEERFFDTFTRDGKK